MLNLSQLQTNPMLEFAIPFVLFYAVLYGALKISNVFQNDNKTNVLISFAVSMLAAAEPNARSLLWTYMPTLAVALVGLAVLLMGKGFLDKLFGGKAGKSSIPSELYAGLGIIFLIMLAMSVYVFGDDFLGSQTKSVLFVLVLLVFVKLARKGVGEKLGDIEPNKP